MVSVTLTLILFVWLANTVRGAALETESWCAPLGCAGGDCTCPSFFTFCDVTTDVNGVCTLTQYGIWVIVALVVVLVALVVFLVLCLCCCGCCPFCRPSKVVRHVWEPVQSDHDNL